MHQDRRQHLRQSITRPLYVSLNGLCSGGIVNDVSEGGVALDIIVGLKPQSDDVILHFELSEISERFETKGRITWTKEPENRVGLKFVGLTESSRIQIKKWLSTNNASPQNPNTGEPVDTPRSPDRHDEKELPSVENIYAPDTRGAGQGRRVSALSEKPPEVAFPPESHEEEKRVPFGFDQKTSSQNWGADIVSAQHPRRQREEVVDSAPVSHIDVTHTKTAEAEATKSKGIRDSMFEVGLQSERAEPATNAGDLQVTGTPRRDDFLPERGDQLVHEISKWPESVAAHLEQIGWVKRHAQDNAPIQVPLPQSGKKLTAKPLGAKENTESKEGKAGRVAGPTPRLRGEREKPLTNTPKTQASATPSHPWVRPKLGKQLIGEMKKCFVNKSPAEDLQPNTLTQQPTNEVPPVRRRARQSNKTAEPAISRPIGGIETKLAEPDVRSADAVSFPDPLPRLRNKRKEAAPIEGGMQASQTIRIPVAAPEQKDKLVQALRSSFGQPDPRSVSAPPLQRIREEGAFDWQVLRQWIVAAVVVFLLIVSLAVAGWIYTSPAFDKIWSASGIREMIAGAFNSANGRGEVAHNVDLKGPAKVEQQSRRKMRKPKTNEMRGVGVKARVPGRSTTRFEVLEARGGRILPQTGATATAPSEHAVLVETTQLSPAQPIPGSQTEERAGSETGHVSLHPTSEVPEKMILPKYPVAALQRSVQGRVMLNAVINKDGVLQNIRVVGAPSLLSEAVLEAVQKWRYRLHTENGMPVEAETQITIDFEK